MESLFQGELVLCFYSMSSTLWKIRLIRVDTFELSDEELLKASLLLFSEI